MIATLIIAAIALSTVATLLLARFMGLGSDIDARDEQARTADWGRAFLGDDGINHGHLND